MPRKRAGVGQHGGETGGAGALGQRHLQREEGVHRALEVRLLDEQHFFHQLADDRKGELAGFLDRDAVGERRAAAGACLVVQLVPQRRIKRALDADDLDFRPCRLGGDRHARDQPAAADGNDQQVEIGRVGEHFERDGALAGDHLRIVERMHEDEALVRRDFLGALPDSATVSPNSTTRAPCASVAATFTNGVISGITMVARMPSLAA